MARAATAPELALYRTPGKASILRCAILKPPIVFRARINQTFSTYDQVLSIIYDGGSGTLADVLPDMEVWIGSTLDAHDKGICRLRDKDATHFYLSETSEIAFADNDYVTILAGFGVWARPVRITTDGTVYMDEITYTDQHSAWDPQPNMGPHQVLELTGATVNATFSGSSSFCPGSTISAYAWSCATASASSGTTTATPTFQFNSVGWHIVYLTITAANGKSFFGVRYVYVWDQDNPPPLAMITNPGHVDVDSGGWEIELTLFTGASLSDFYDRAMVILFAEDHYGDTVQAIGPVGGSANIRFIGWISSEAHHIESEQPAVTFQAHGAAYWMTKIPSWPDGVEISSATPDAWTKVQGLTVNYGFYHFLRWRSTITRIMDVNLTNDTRLSQEVGSAAQNLWAQLQEMTWSQIYARPGVNALNQLTVEIHPSLTPTGDRAYPTVMAITKADYADALDFDREIVDQVGIVDMSGVAVISAGNGSAYFALAPGHSLPHYGEWDLQPNLLLASQAQVIALAGLYRSWRNNPYKNIPIVFDAAIALIDCFPNQKCTIDIQAGDNVRGFAYNGGLLPTSVDLVQDPDTGYLHTEVVFEAETSESQARVGDTPGSGDTDGPVSPSFPPLPDLPVILPGWPPTGESSRAVILHDPDDVAHTGKGIVYTTNFDAASPSWLTMNGGLTQPQYASINRIIVTPGGAVYVACEGRWLVGASEGIFIARAPSLGGSFTVLKTEADIESEYGASGGDTMYMGALACRPDLPETVLYVAGRAIPPFGDTSDIGIYLGSDTSFAQTATITDFRLTGMLASASFGQSTWAIIYPTVVGIGSQVKYHRYNAGATAESLVSTVGGTDSRQVRGGISEVIYVMQDAVSTQFAFSDDNGSSWQFLPSSNDMNSGAAGLAADDLGRCVMARWTNTGYRGKSSDYGATWVGLPSLPVSNTYVWGYLGGLDAASQWVVAGPAGVVRYSPDFGTTWTNKEGDFAALGTARIDLVVPIRTVAP